jgi:hypothetical protein
VMANNLNNLFAFTSEIIIHDVLTQTRHFFFSADDRDVSDGLADGSRLRQLCSSMKTRQKTQSLLRGVTCTFCETPELSYHHHVLY